MESTTQKTPAKKGYTTWKVALPFVTCAAGATAGKLFIGKSWGWAAGLGFTCGALGCIPLALEHNTIKSATIGKEERPQAEAPAITKEETSSRPQAEAPAVTSTTAPTVKTEEVLAVMQEAAKKQGKEGEFETKKESFTKAVDGFDDKQRNLMIDMLKLTGTASPENKSTAKEKFNSLMFNMDALQKKYGTDFVKSFFEKIKALGI